MNSSQTALLDQTSIGTIKVMSMVASMLMKKKILLVEDDLNTQKIVEFLLKDEYQVYKAGHGVEALQLLDKIPEIDLVITDMQMPIMNGLALVHAMNNSLEKSQIPVMILSSDCHQELVNMGKYPNLVNSLLKPLEPSELYWKVEAALVLEYC